MGAAGRGAAGGPGAGRGGGSRGTARPRPRCPLLGKGPESGGPCGGVGSWGAGGPGRRHRSRVSLSRPLAPPRSEVAAFRCPPPRAPPGDREPAEPPGAAGPAPGVTPVRRGCPRPQHCRQRGWGGRSCPTAAPVPALGQRGAGPSLARCALTRATERDASPGALRGPRPAQHGGTLPGTPPVTGDTAPPAGTHPQEHSRCPGAKAAGPTCAAWGHGVGLGGGSGVSTVAGLWPELARVPGPGQGTPQPGRARTAWPGAARAARAAPGARQ